MTEADARGSARHTTTTGVMHPGTMLTDAIRQWPTPRAEDIRHSTRAAGTGGRILAQEATQQWRTPDAPNAGGPRNRQTSIGHGHQVTIAEQAEHWPTPNVPNGGRTTAMTNYTPDGRKRQKGLEAVGQQWPTPGVVDGEQAMAHKGRNPTLNGAVLSRSFLPLLATETDGALCSPADPTSPQLSLSDSWSTPRAQCNIQNKKNLPPPSQGGRSSKPGLQDQIGPKAKLNPLFVEWLMGFPVGWTGCGPAATEWSRWQQRMHSALLMLVSGER